VAVLGGTEIYIKFGHGVDPYFHLPTSGYTNGLRKVWFLLTNNADMPLPMFTGSYPVAQPNWGYRVAWRDLRRLQCLCEVIHQLLHEGLTGADLLLTFFSCRVQPLRQRVMTMWMYPGPRCPDCPFSEELGDTDMNTQIHRVLAHGADMNPGAGPAPLRQGVDSIRVSLFASAFGSLCNLIFSWHLCSPTGSCVFSQ
jgi:hypothetical protein